MADLDIERTVDALAAWADDIRTAPVTPWPIVEAAVEAGWGE